MSSPKKDNSTFEAIIEKYAIKRALETNSKGIIWSVTTKDKRVLDYLLNDINEAYSLWQARIEPDAKKQDVYYLHILPKDNPETR